MANKEISESYKLGYKIGFKMAVLAVMKHSDNDELINELIKDYNAYPLIDKISINNFNKSIEEFFKEINNGL